MLSTRRVESTPSTTTNRVAVGFLYIVFVAATVAGIFVARLEGAAPWTVAVASFTAVIAASLVLSWSGEAGEFLISQGFIVAMIALLQVLPEFMIEAVFAWRRDRDNMLANLTGSNRLLMGLGWPMIYVTAMTAHWLKTRKLLGPIVLEPKHAIEVWALVISSGYFVVILLRGSFVVLDGVVLFGMFLAYLILLWLMPPEEEGKEDLLAPSRFLIELPVRLCVGVILGLMLLSGATMVLIATPFVDSMRRVSAQLGIREFYFVQWVAPFLTEFPEKVTAFYWAKRVTTAPIALLNMVSSKVNQWTLLASMIPIVYAASLAWSGQPIEAVVLTPEHKAELWLSLAMTMYGAACLLKRRFTGVNCAVLFGLWLVQFLNPDAEHGFIHAFDTRRLTTYIFAGLAPVEALVGLRVATPIADLREIRALLRRR